MPEKTYTYAEAAEKLGIAPGTLRVWVSKGKIAHHRLGGGVRFTDEDLEAAYTPVPALPRTRRRRASRR